MVNPKAPEVNTPDRFSFEVRPDYQCSTCGNTAPPRRFHITISDGIAAAWAYCSAAECRARGPEAVDWKRIAPRTLVDAAATYEVTP